MANGPNIFQMLLVIIFIRNELVKSMFVRAVGYSSAASGNLLSGGN